MQRAAHHAACANRKRRSSTGIRARRHVQTQIAILGVWRTGHKRCAPICAPAVPAVSALSVCSFPKSADFTGREWRPRPESNRGTRICSPMRHHSATWPLALSYHDRRRMKSSLVRREAGEQSGRGVRPEDVERRVRLLSLTVKSARPIASPLLGPEGRKVQAPLKLSSLMLAVAAGTGRPSPRARPSRAQGPRSGTQDTPCRLRRKGPCQRVKPL